MIDVKELRIGDYVYLQNSKTPYKITELVYSEIEYPRYEASGISTESVFRTYVENLNPIPISEEILLTCGFKLWSKTINKLCSDVYRLNVDNGSVVFEAVGGTVMVLSDGNYLCNNIATFHQLQNLYVDLTGKELEVNL